MEIFKLVGNIFVDNEKANKSIENTDKKGMGLGKTFQKMGKGALKFGKVLGGAALAGGAAILALAKKTGDAADRLLDLSSVTGMSTDEIQKWEKVATVAGVSADAMTNVSSKLTKQMDILSTGTGKAAEAADELGLSYEVLDEMSPDERMNALVEALQGVEDPAERAKLGTDLLGGAWDELAPILEVGAERLKDVKDNANIISEDDLNQANEFRIKMDQMKEKAIDFGMGLATKLMPFLNKMFDWITDNMPMIEKVFSDVFKAIGATIDFIVPIIRDVLIPAFMTIANWVKEHLPIIKTTFENIFNAIADIVKVFIELVQAFWDKFGDHIMAAVTRVWGFIKTSISNALDVIKGIFKLFISIFKGDWEGAWNAIKDILSAVWSQIENIVQMGIDVLKTIVEFGFNAIKGFAESIFGGVADIIGGIWDGIINGIKASINVAIDLINSFIRKANKIQINLPGEKADFGVNIKELNRLQVGGELIEDGPVMVGEVGPEVLDLPRGAKVIPLNKIPPNESQANVTEVNNQFNISELVVREDADIDKIARELFNLQKETERGFGV